MKRIKDFKNFKLNEFNESDSYNHADRLSFMEKLYKLVKKITPDDFKIVYIEGKELSMYTNDNKKLVASAKIDDNKMVINAKPSDKPEYEYNFDFGQSDMDSILNIFIDEIDRIKTDKSTLQSTPILNRRDLKSFIKSTTRPVYKSRKGRKFISIDDIVEVLENAYINEEIGILIDEEDFEFLIDRMLNVKKGDTD